MNSKLNSKINDLIDKYNLNSLDVTSNPRELIIMLLSHIKKTSIANIKLDIVKIEDKDIEVLENMLNKIANEKIPPQYVTNKEYIYGDVFNVSESVLIPRQDTETLIEFAIKSVNEKGYKTALDMCTGSGIIGILIAKHTEISHVTLSDVSQEALQVARENINLNGVENKCNIIQSNMFDAVYKLNNKYDIILSNPPYLTKGEMKELSEFVEKEPSIALYGGKDGLDFYKIIYSDAKNFLNDGGMIAVEIGYTQAQDVIDIILSHKCYKDIQVIQDINNKDRVVVCHFQNK